MSSSISETIADPEHKATGKSRFMLLTLGCIGVVYGDIGTSPLYAFKQAANIVASDGIPQPYEIKGIASLIVWELILVVTLKYILFLLRVDNRGEGGILSLMALARKTPARISSTVFFLGLLGAALFYGDAAITPAISVLSAVEGLELVTPIFKDYTLIIAIFLLFLLFSAQSRGTHKVSILFLPIMILWFSAMGINGLVWIFKNPSILAALNPIYGISFILSHEALSLMVLGATFLAVTGAETLYADLGHFGRKPIQTAWACLIFPALALNYLGQGALILSKPSAIENPFFLMVSGWAILPLVILATMATIIASQAVITGAFSLTRQAMLLGLLPRMEIRHTSADQHGQIYIPKMNRLLFCAVLLFLILFDTSDNLGAAYGIAVNGTMIVTTLLAFIVIWKIYNRRLWVAIACVTPFLMVELVFMSSNMFKIFDGGFIPLLLAALLVVSMSVWVKGSNYLYKRSHRQSIYLSDLVEKLEREEPVRVPGTAVFLTSDPTHAPIAMMQNLKHNNVLHEQNVILSIITSHFPKVPENQRVSVEFMSSSLVRVEVHYGFMENPHVPRALIAAKAHGLDVDISHASYFLGRRSIIADPRRGLPPWQDAIYIAMAHSAEPATDFYRLPTDRVVELGIRLAI